MSFIEQFIAHSRESFENIELAVLKECFYPFLENLSDESQGSIIRNRIALPQHVLEGGDLLKGFNKLEEKGLAIAKSLLPKAYLYFETIIESSYKYSEYICLFLDYFNRNTKNIFKNSIFYNITFKEHFKEIGLNEKEIVFILSILGDLNFIKLIWQSNPNPHENDPLYEDLQITEITTKGKTFLQTKCIIKKYNDLIRFIRQIRDDYLDEEYVGVHLKILANKLEQDHNNWVINYLRIDFIHEKQEELPVESYSTDNKAIFYQEIIDIDSLFSNFTENGCVYESKNHRFFFDEKISVPFNIEGVKEKFNTNSYQYHSNKIEGSTLTLREVALAVNEPNVPINKPTYHIIKANLHMKIYDNIITSRTPIYLSMETVKDWHSILFSLYPLRNNFAGLIRQGRIYIVGSNFVPPPGGIACERLIDELFEWFNKNKDSMHPVLLACLMHFYLVSIHPFEDGNGRMSRLIMN